MTKGLYRNPISYIGLLIIAFSTGLILLTLLLQFSIKDPSPYLGIFTYLLLPIGVVFGLLLFLYGMRWESLRRRRLKVTEARPYPRLDLNDPRQRKWFIIVSLASFLLLVLMTFVAYNGFLLTESVAFCGKTCHTVMEPEYTAYLASPHARVACVDCHVGHGAKWYVKSKLSGARQVLAVLLDNYERPIPVPIENLRPARETCEECHWPEKFYGKRVVEYPHFRYDEQNTEERMSLILKTGGGSPMFGGTAEGIHSAMVIRNEVYFRATDRAQNDIVWVKVRSLEHGSERVYVSEGTTLDEASIEALPIRRMDCMDCHNRPTHIFPPPDVSVDKAMASGLISPKLPWIKKVAVDAITREYPGREEAHRRIREEVLSFYRDRYPEVAQQASKELEGAIEAMIAIRDRAVFEAMKVDWKTYGMNNGHRNWPGCFRCHDGRHKTPEGDRVIPRACDTCHSLPRREAVASPEGQMDWHRWPLLGRHADLLCNRCHQAGFRPEEDCATCHGLDKNAPMMSQMGCDDCHKRPQEVKPVEDCLLCHEEVSGLHKEGGHPEAPCVTCHKPHKWSVKGREICLSCHKDKGGHYEGGECASCHSFKGADENSSEGNAQE